MPDQRIKRSLRCVSADVQFIKNSVFQFYTLPVALGPLECAGIDQLRWTVHSLRLEARSRVRQFARPIQPVDVPRTSFHSLDHCGVISAISPVHVDEPIFLSENVNAGLP